MMLAYMVAFAVGATSLMGWATGALTLTSWHPDWVTMKAYTSAVLCGCAGLGLLYRRLPVVAIGGAVFVGAINNLAPVFDAGHLFSLFPILGDHAKWSTGPGEPSLCTLAGFVVFALGLLVVDQPIPAMIRKTPGVFLVVVSAIPIAAYLYAVLTGLDPPAMMICHSPGGSSAMAASTAVGFGALGVGLIRQGRVRLGPGRR